MFGLRDLVASELTTIRQTRQHLQGIAEAYPAIIELLLAIPQLMDKTNEQLDEAESSFFFYGHYIQAHSTAFCIYKAYEAGYYLEATILIRHLLEAFVQMRYFKNHLDRLRQHLTGHRVQFRVMFDEFSPGFYKRYYSLLLSEAAHGMMLKYIMRAVPTAENPNGQLVIGNRFDENHAPFVINNMTAVLSGYFNYLDSFLPRNLIRRDPDLGKRFEEQRQWLNDSVDAFTENRPEAIDFINHCHALFR